MERPSQLLQCVLDACHTRNNSNFWALAFNSLQTWFSVRSSQPTVPGSYLRPFTGNAAALFSRSQRCPKPIVRGFWMEALRSDYRKSTESSSQAMEPCAIFCAFRMDKRWKPYGCRMEMAAKQVMAPKPPMGKTVGRNLGPADIDLTERRSACRARSAAPSGASSA